jgi:hypothetical protein
MSADLRAEILRRVDARESQRSIARALDMPAGTVAAFLHRVRGGPSLERIPVPPSVETAPPARSERPARRTPAHPRAKRARPPAPPPPSAPIRPSGDWPSGGWAPTREEVSARVRRTLWAVCAEIEREVEDGRAGLFVLNGSAQMLAVALARLGDGAPERLEIGPPGSFEAAALAARVLDDLEAAAGLAGCRLLGPGEGGDGGELVTVEVASGGGNGAGGNGHGEAAGA